MISADRNPRPPRRENSRSVEVTGGPRKILRTIVDGVTVPAANPPWGEALWSVARWPPRRWFAAGLTGAGTALLVGVPTAVLPNAFFTRMTPVLWWNYPVWVVTALLVGLTVATYVRAAPGVDSRPGRVTGGGLLSAFAVGCPVCNKLVVAALGTSGALTIWAPLQPLIAVAALVLLGYTFLRRLRGELVCLIPSWAVAASDV